VAGGTVVPRSAVDGVADHLGLPLRRDLLRRWLGGKAVLI
jgi:hypothetical protein